MQKKHRLAKIDEKSLRLKVKGYKAETCSGKCRVLSYKISDESCWVIYGIKHHCGEGK